MSTPPDPYKQQDTVDRLAVVTAFLFILLVLAHAYAFHTIIKLKNQVDTLTESVHSTGVAVEKHLRQ